MDSDRDFGKVETAVKQRENIFSVDEYQSIMTNSFRKSKVTVTRIGEKMVDISALGQSLRLVKQTKDVSGNKIELRDKVK